MPEPIAKVAKSKVTKRNQREISFPKPHKRSTGNPTEADRKAIVKQIKKMQNKKGMALPDDRPIFPARTGGSSNPSILDQLFDSSGRITKAAAKFIESLIPSFPGASADTINETLFGEFSTSQQDFEKKSARHPDYLAPRAQVSGLKKLAEQSGVLCIVSKNLKERADQSLEGVTVLVVNMGSQDISEDLKLMTLIKMLWKTHSDPDKCDKFMIPTAPSVGKDEGNDYYIKDRCSVMLQKMSEADMGAFCVPIDDPDHSLKSSKAFHELIEAGIKYAKLISHTSTQAKYLSDAQRAKQFHPHFIDQLFALSERLDIVEQSRTYDAYMKLFNADKKYSEVIANPGKKRNDVILKNIWAHSDSRVTKYVHLHVSIILEIKKEIMARLPAIVLVIRKELALAAQMHPGQGFELRDWQDPLPHDEL